MSNPLELKQVCDIKSQLTNKHITYEEIAYKLIQDRFLLTALELHRELSESGRELKQLKEYFLNPGNLNLSLKNWNIYPLFARSGSQVTLDSLDLTRYSEDGATTEDKVAVLEFELRRAKETINALRNNLTLATEYKTCSSDKSSLKNINVGTIKPHEQRPLNFLINEYLLHHGYKLTSITFADENQSQDFDDWEDVGLNTPRPPELLFLFREGLKQTRQNSQNVSTQTKHSDEDNTKDTEEGQLNEVIHILKVKNAELNDDSLKLKEEIKYLSSRLVECNKEKLAVGQKDKSSDTHSKNLLLSPSVQKSEICEQNISIFKKR
ncbi:hypothetical protein NQ317_018337 [Molorchus minor]|uniref:LisH domain-containing protein n=1 Tax=Molorchus minor TaxID=1323400 RepID=A0ABQ9J6I2_9CUCU|nr:hypothetical protein NQ317_018337 [Molorchus minor]